MALNCVGVLVSKIEKLCLSKNVVSDDIFSINAYRACPEGTWNVDTELSMSASKILSSDDASWQRMIISGCI